MISWRMRRHPIPLIVIGGLVAWRIVWRPANAMCAGMTMTGCVTVAVAAVTGASMIAVAARAAWLAVRSRRAPAALPRHEIPESLAEAARRMRVDRLVCLAGDDATAFCAGLLRPRVYLTEGVVRVLDPGALDAVLVHESAHARRRDPLRRLCVHATSAPLLGLLTRGQAQGAFRDDLPVQWLVTVFYSLIHAAAAEVQARRLSAKAAPDILADTLLAALRRQPSASEG